MIVFDVLDHINNKSYFLDNQIHAMKVVSETARNCALFSADACGVKDPSDISRIEISTLASTLTAVIIMKKLFGHGKITDKDVVGNCKTIIEGVSTVTGSAVYFYCKQHNINGIDTTVDEALIQAGIRISIKAAVFFKERLDYLLKQFPFQQQRMRDIIRDGYLHLFQRIIRAVVGSVVYAIADAINDLAISYPNQPVDPAAIEATIEATARFAIKYLDIDVKVCSIDEENYCYIKEPINKVALWVINNFSTYEKKSIDEIIKNYEEDD